MIPGRVCCQATPPDNAALRQVTEIAGSIPGVICCCSLLLATTLNIRQKHVRPRRLKRNASCDPCSSTAKLMLKLRRSSSLSVSLASIKTDQNSPSESFISTFRVRDLRLSLGKLLAANEPRQSALWRPEAEVPFAPLISWHK